MISKTAPVWLTQITLHQRYLDILAELPKIYCEKRAFLKSGQYMGLGLAQLCPF